MLLAAQPRYCVFNCRKEGMLLYMLTRTQEAERRCFPPSMGYSPQAVDHMLPANHNRLGPAAFEPGHARACIKVADLLGVALLKQAINGDPGALLCAVSTASEPDELPCLQMHTYSYSHYTSAVHLGQPRPQRTGCFSWQGKQHRRNHIDEAQLVLSGHNACP